MWIVPKAIPGADDRADFVVQEVLGQRWRNECIHFSLTATQKEHVRRGHALVGPGAVNVPYQRVEGSNEHADRIVAALDLDPFEVREYGFSDSAAETQPTDLIIREMGNYINLVNSRTGISLRRSLKDDEGPIEAVRMAGGGWVGDSRCKLRTNASDYRVEITARGPVYSEVACRLKRSQDQQWELRLRLYSNEPVVVVDEQFSLKDDSEFRLGLSHDFSPDRLFYRAGNDVVGKNSTWQIDLLDKQPVFVLEPWLHWWEHDRQGNWFGLYSSSGRNFLGLGALEPGLWIDPSQPIDRRSAAQILVTQDADNVWMKFPLRQGRRKWIIMSFDQSTALALPAPTSTGRGPGISKFSTLPQKYVVKHGDFPLDKVLTATKPWTDSLDKQVIPLVGEANIKELQRRLTIDSQLMARFQQQPIEAHGIELPIAYYLATDDAKLGAHLAMEAMRLIQFEVDTFYQQDNSPTLGAEPHRRANGLLPSVNLAALMLGTGALTADQSQRLRSQLAFLADTVSRPDFYSPARGYSANPNMTSTVAAFQVRIAGAIPSHPRSPGWIEGGLRELKRELHQWSDANGGWLEAPHYAVVAYDTLMGCFLSAHLAGQDDVLFDPKMKRVALWLAKMSSPPDVRLQGWRHHLPLGNTYQRETTSVYGQMATLWREKDPEFSAQMQWMHRQSGAPAFPGVGGFFPTLAGVRTVLLDPTLPVAAPDWKSELFPETGVILRNGFPSSRETQLSLIAGRNHDHYDDDSGSITLWGKGAQLANDFGYVGNGTIEDHNLLISASGQRGVMRIQDFTGGEHVDFVRGVRDEWTRQIAFIKDPEPLGSNYFVMTDSVAEAGPLKWQLWLTAQDVKATKQGVHVQGLDDVDLDVMFNSPAELRQRLTRKERKCLAMRPDGSADGNHIVSQTGLIVDTDKGQQICAVLFPRLKTDPPPVVTTLIDGKALRVQTEAGTDYVFLNDKPFQFQSDDLSFTGTSGVIQMRGDLLRLALGSTGRIAARGRELRSDHAEDRQWNLKP